MQAAPQATRSRLNNPVIQCALAVLALLLVVLRYLPQTRGETYRIDEAHKVADTAFYRILTERGPSDEEWFRHIVDRTNPPLPKLIFGLAGALQGAKLPSTPAIRMELPEGRLGQTLPGDSPSVYHPLLVAIRRVSLLATALAVGATVWLAGRIAGPIAALVAALFEMGMYLTPTFAATAVYDPLLASFTILSAIPLLLLWERKRSRAAEWILVCCAAALCALAWQVRITGLVAAGSSTLVLLALALKRRTREPLGFAAVLCVVTFLGGVALNPYLWSRPDPSPNVPPEFISNEPLPRLVMSRLALQMRDLSTLLKRDGGEQGRLDLGERFSFSYETLMGDYAGLLAILGAILCIPFAFQRGSPLFQGFRFALLWGGAVVLTVIIWLPLAWPRYLLICVPPVAILGALGWTEFARQLVTQFRRKSAETTA